MKQNFYVPLGVGLESDIAEQLVQPGSVTQLEDAIFDQRGQIVRRCGFDLLSASNQATQPAAGVLPPVWKLATLGGQLVRFSKAPTPVHAWAPQSATWVRPTDNTLHCYRTGPTSVATAPVLAEVPAGEQVANSSTAIGGNYQMTVFDYTGAGGIRTQHIITDLTTGTQVLSRITGVGTRRPRAVIIGTNACVAYEDNGNLQIDRYDLTSLSLVEARAVDTCFGGTYIEVRLGAPDGLATRFSVLYRASAGGGFMKAISADATNLATAYAYEIQAAGGVTAVPVLALGWMQDFGASGKFAVIMADTVNGLRVLWDIPSPTSSVSVAAATHILDGSMTAISTGTTPGIRNVIGTTTSNSSSGLYRVLYEFAAPALTMVTLAEIRQAVWSGSAVTAVAYRSVGIRSKLWANDTNFYFWAVFPGDEQKSYFVLAFPNDLTVPTIRSAPQAVAFPRSASGLSEVTNQASDVATGPHGEFVVALPRVTRVESIVAGGTAHGSTQDIKSIERISLTHRPSPDPAVGQPVEFLGALFTSGGTLGAFDGTTYAHPGFAYYPPPVAVTSGGAGGDMTPSSRYYFVAVYSFLDSRGRKWRSAPSVPMPFDTTGTDFQASVNIETLRLVDRGLPSLTNGYQIELYSTQAGETEAYFLVGSVNNDPTATLATIAASVADTALGEELYTDGGGLENQLLPAVSQVAVFQRRLFVAEAGTGTLWYSLDADLNHGLIYNEAMTHDVGDPLDPITGLCATDNYLVVFKSTGVYVLTGQGANALGQGDTYESRRLEGGVGTVNAASIVTAPEGAVWFKSNSARAGFHRVNGLSVEYVGQGVRKYDSSTVMAAVMVGHRSELRFYTDDHTLVYNLVTQAWGTNRAQVRSPGVSATLAATTGYGPVPGAVTASGIDGGVYAENDAAVKDGAFSFPMRVRSPWFAVEGMAGWERIASVTGVGTNPRAHKLTVTLYRDYDATSVVGSLVKHFDGTGTKWEWQIKPKIQKVTALMVDIVVENYSADVVTQGPEISGVTLRVDVKRGIKKMGPSARSAS